MGEGRGVDAAIVHMTEAGQIIETWYYGTASNDFLTSVHVDESGNCLLVYETWPDGQSQSSTFLKLNSEGGIVWQRTLARDSAHVSVRSIVLLADGSVVGGGMTMGEATSPAGVRYSNGYLVKLNALGEVVWERTYGGYHNDYVQAIDATDDGGYILIGDSQSFNFDNNYDIYAIKTDSAGEMLWYKIIGDHRINGSQDVITTSSGNYLFVGESVPETSMAAFDVIIGCLSPTGELLWSRHNGGVGKDAGFAVIELPGNKFAITGYSTSHRPAEAYDVFVMITDGQGEEELRRYYGSTGIDIGYDIIRGRNGELFIAAVLSDVQDTTLDTQNFLIRCLPMSQTDVAESVEQRVDNQNLLSYDSERRLLVLRTALRQNAVISIIDIQGRVVAAVRVSANQQEIRCPVEFRTGIYGIAIETAATTTHEVLLIVQ